MYQLWTYFLVFLCLTLVIQATSGVYSYPQENSDELQNSRFFNTRSEYLPSLYHALYEDGFVGLTYSLNIILVVPASLQICQILQEKHCNWPWRRFPTVRLAYQNKLLRTINQSIHFYRGRK